MLPIFRTILEVTGRYNFTGLVLLLSAACFPGIAQDATVRAYGVDEGLARPDVISIYQDRRGLLWVGTDGAGLYTFNLGRFSQTTLSPDRTGYRILKLEEGTDGQLYILSETGLFAYDGREIVKIAEPPVIDFASTEAGVWWISDTEICLVSSNSMAKCYSGTGEFLMATPDGPGVVLVSDTELKEYDNPVKGHTQFLMRDTGRVIDNDGAGNIWRLAGDGRLIRISGTSQDEFNVRPGNVNTVLAGAVGSVFLGTDEGVFVFQSSDTTLIPLPVQAHVNCLYFDARDRLWIGTQDRGLLRYFGEQYNSWKLPDDIRDPQILPGPSVSQTTVLSGPSRAFLLFDHQQEIRMPWDGRGQLYYDLQHNLWALTADGLWMRRDTQWLKLDSTLHWDGARNQIAGRSPFGLWIEQGDGLMHYGVEAMSFPAGVRLSAQEVEGDIPDDALVDILTDHAGITWRIGRNSMGMIDQQEYLQTQRFDYDVLSAAADPVGGLWVGTRAAGIYYFPSGAESPVLLRSTYPIRTADILFLHALSNQLIAGTERHVLRLHLDSARSAVIRVDGMDEDAGMELERMGRDDYALTADGHLLISQNNVIFGLNLKHGDVLQDAPEIFIDRVLLNGTDIQLTRHASAVAPFYQQLRPVLLKPSERRMTFELAAASVSREPVYFQWRQEPDEEWSELSRESTVQLFDLKPGTYVFQARACDTSGNCSDLQMPWRFVVQTALWERWWFWAMSGVVFIGLLLWLFSTRKRRRTVTADLERRRLEAELQAITQEQKALQLQMNPHFIFNALQTLRSQIRDDRLETARENLTHFANLMRTMLDMSRRGKVTLEEELEFLQTYVDVEAMGSSVSMIYKVEMEEEIEAFAIEIPSMLIQPLIENAIRHGMRDNRVEITLHISEQPGMLQVEVRDKGPGVTQTSSGHQSAALDIIRNRLRKTGKGGDLTIQSKPEEGVRVLLKIPVT